MAAEIIAIAYSDLHIENWRKFNEGGRRLKNSLDVVKTMKVQSKKLGVPIIFGGDLFHKEKGITNELMADTFPTLVKLFSGNMTYAITGNHDQSRQNTRENESPSYIKTLSKISKSFECIDFKSTEISGIGLHGIPYLTHDIGLVESINSIITHSKKNILLLHTTMPGARDTDNREIQSHINTKGFYKAIERFDLILTGHIHKPDTYKVNGVQVVQMGAPQHQRLTDRNCDMGYWEIYSDLTFKFKHLKKYPRFVEIEDMALKVDNHDFYILKEKKKEIKENRKSNMKFNNKLDRGKLANNYCKERSIKDKVKRTALQNALKATE